MWPQGYCAPAVIFILWSEAIFAQHWKQLVMQTVYAFNKNAAHRRTDVVLFAQSRLWRTPKNVLYLYIPRVHNSNHKSHIYAAFVGLHYNTVAE
jgi:hypothetical protein